MGGGGGGTLVLEGGAIYVEMSAHVQLYKWINQKDNTVLYLMLLFLTVKIMSTAHMNIWMLLNS